MPTLAPNTSSAWLHRPMRARLRRGVLIAAILASTVPAEARANHAQAAGAVLQQAQGRAAMADADMKVALIERYFRATNLRTTAIGMVRAMSEAHPPVGLSAREREIYDDVVAEVADLTFDRLAAEFAEIYAQAFTLGELQLLVDFYESPVGQSLMTKTAELAGRSAEIVPRLTAFFTETLQSRLCARIDCSPPTPVTRPSLDR